MSKSNKWFKSYERSYTNSGDVYFIKAVFQDKMEGESIKQWQYGGCVGEIEKTKKYHCVRIRRNEFEELHFLENDHEFKKYINEDKKLVIRNCLIDTYVIKDYDLSYVDTEDSLVINVNIFNVRFIYCKNSVILSVKINNKSKNNDSVGILVEESFCDNIMIEGSTTQDLHCDYLIFRNTKLNNMAWKYLNVDNFELCNIHRTARRESFHITNVFCKKSQMYNVDLLDRKIKIKNLDLGPKAIIKDCNLTTKQVEGLKAVSSSVINTCMHISGIKIDFNASYIIGGELSGSIRDSDFSKSYFKKDVSLEKLILERVNLRGSDLRQFQVGIKTRFNDVYVDRNTVIAEKQLKYLDNYGGLSLKQRDKIKISKSFWSKLVGVVKWVCRVLSFFASLVIVGNFFVKKP